MVEGYMQVNVFINMTYMSHIQSSCDNQRVVKEKRDTNQLNHTMYFPSELAWG